MTRRTYALLLLWILTGCTAQLQQLPPPSSTEPAQASPVASCVALSVASSSWPTAQQIFTAWLEAQRVRACQAQSASEPTAP
jgi:hypothetical protein